MRKTRFSEKQMWLHNYNGDDMNLMLDRPLVFFDIESTGTDRQNDRIIDIALMKLAPEGNIKGWLTFRVNPCVPIPEETTKIHGITNEMVEDRPKFNEIIPQIIEFIKDCDLAGFNSNAFDIPLLYIEFLRNGYNWDYSKIKFIDIGNIFKLLQPRTLEAAYSHYIGGELENAHMALADTKATLDVFLKMMDNHKDVLPSKVDDIALYSNYGKKVLDISGKFTYNEKDEIVFTFGAYRNERAIDHIDYLEWILSKDFNPDTKKICYDIINANKTEVDEDEDEFYGGYDAHS